MQRRSRKASWSASSERSSRSGDLVADFFCGSGTTLAVAEKNDRRWIGSDLGRFAIHTSRKRMLDVRVRERGSMEKRMCKPFEVLNLGRYERKYWQGITFGNGACPGAPPSGPGRLRTVRPGPVQRPATPRSAHPRQEGEWPRARRCRGCSGDH